MAVVTMYQQKYLAQPCERCGGGRVDYRLVFEGTASPENVCLMCARASLVLSPMAREA